MSNAVFYYERNGHDIAIDKSQQAADHAHITTSGKRVDLPKGEAPRAAAALLRAAGWGRPKEHGRTPLDNSIDAALDYLDAVTNHQDNMAAKAAYKAAIQEEARELYEAASSYLPNSLGWNPDNPTLVAVWEAAARQARTIHERAAK